MINRYKTNIKIYYISLLTYNLYLNKKGIKIVICHIVQLLHNHINIFKAQYQCL